MIAGLGDSKKSADGIIEANVLYHSLLDLASHPGNAQPFRN
jgi:hypothetical protein